MLVAEQALDVQEYPAPLSVELVGADPVDRGPEAELSLRALERKGAGDLPRRALAQVLDFLACPAERSSLRRSTTT
jgi:hypothetical protein